MSNKRDDNYLKRELYELIKTDESIFDFIQESSLDGLWYWDLEHPENEWMNPKFWTVLGYNPHEMPHQSSAWQTIVNPDDLRIAIENVTRHFENPEYPYDQVVRYKHKNGSTVWIRCRGMAIRNKEGKPVRMLGAHHNVTELKNNELALSLAKEQTEEIIANVTAILEGTADNIWAFDTNYRIIYINNIFQKEFQRAFGVWLEKGSSLIDALPEAIRPIWKERYDRALSNEQFTIVDEIETAIGKLFVQVTFNPIVKGNEVIGGSCFGSDITHRIEAEEELQKRERRFSQLIQNSYDTIVILDADGIQRYVSPSAETMHGFSPSELVDIPVIERMIHPDDQAEVLAAFKEVIETGTGSIQYRHRKKEGGWVHLEAHATNQLDNPDIRGVVVNVRDITDRKKAEERLQKSEENLRSIIENSPVGFHIYNLDDEGRLVFSMFNPSADEILHVDHKQYLGQEILDAFPALAGTGIPEMYTSVAKGELATQKFEIPYKHQRIKGVYSVNVFQGAPGQAVVNFTDISERRFAEEALKNSEARLRTFVANQPGVAYIVDTDGIFTLSEGQGLKQLGLQPGQVVGLSVFDVYKDVPEICERIKRALAGEVQQFEVTVANLIFDSWIGPVVDEKGDVSAVIGIAADNTQRRCAEEELKQSQARLSALLASMKDMIFEIDINNCFEGYYAQKEKGLYLEPEQFIGKKVTEVLPADIGRLVSDAIKAIHSGESFQQFEYSILIDHELHDESAIVTPRYNELNEIVGFTVVCRNITDRKRTEEKLKESESQFRGLFEHAADAIFIADAETGIIVNANQKASNLLKASIESIIGRHQRELHPPEKSQFSEMSFQKQKAEIDETMAASLVEANVFCSDGTHIPVEVLASKVIYKGNECIMGIFRDITERKRAEELLTERNMFIGSLLKALPVAVFYKDKFGRYLGCNKVFTEIMGVTEDQILGKTAYDLWPNDLAERYHQMDMELMQKKEHQVYEFGVRDKNGNILPVIYAKDVYYGSDGEVAGIVGAFLDITERKQAEAQLIKAKEKAEESDRLKTAFLQNMSHEIRTPLNAIMGYSSLLSGNFYDKEKLANYSKIIEQRGSDLLDIINDILDISKIESGQSKISIENCNLNELFDELSHFFNDYKERMNRQAIELTFHKIPDPSISFIKTDTVKLKQVLINLISNALKFTEKGTIHCGCKLENSKLQFYVSDTGVGIPPDKHEHIFERFSRIETVIANRYVGGTGLGLPIVKGLVKLLGGKVWLESECNKGSIFYFTIDFIRAVPTSTRTDAQGVSQDVVTTKSILIVEDDLYNAEYLKEVLTNVTSNVLTVTDGVSAIKAVQEQKIDLILMDIRLPDMTGYEATRTILRDYPDVKIIAQTAYAANADYKNAMECGCLDYISKPIKQEQLLALMAKHLK